MFVSVCGPQLKDTSVRQRMRIVEGWLWARLWCIAVWQICLSFLTLERQGFVHLRDKEDLSRCRSLKVKKREKNMFTYVTCPISLRVIYIRTKSARREQFCVGASHLMNMWKISTGTSSGKLYHRVGLHSNQNTDSYLCIVNIHLTSDIIDAVSSKTQKYI